MCRKTVGSRQVGEKSAEAISCSGTLFTLKNDVVVDFLLRFRSLGKAPKRGRLYRALKTVNHSLAYARHLARGNHFAGDMSWTKPDTPPVLLAHGFMGTRGTMVPLTQRFQADGRVVFSYHHGTFQLSSLRRSAQEMVDHLQALESELGVTKIDVVGFSMGGLVALHAIKFMQAHRWIRRVALLGTPISGTWAGLAGVSTVGMVSPSVWQVLPTSQFLADLRSAPMPPGIRVRQISAADDALCPLPKVLQGVDRERDYIVLPGGHSSCVVAQPFYAKLREFFDAPEVDLEGTADLEPAEPPAPPERPKLRIAEEDDVSAA